MDTVIHLTTGSPAMGTRLPQDVVGRACEIILAALYQQTGGRRGLPCPTAQLPLEASVSPVDRSRSAGLSEQSNGEPHGSKEMRRWPSKW